MNLNFWPNLTKGVMDTVATRKGRRRKQQEEASRRRSGVK